MVPITLKQGLTVAILSALVSGTASFVGITLADLRVREVSNTQGIVERTYDSNEQQEEVEQPIKQEGAVDINQDGQIDQNDNERLNEVIRYRDLNQGPSQEETERMREIQEEIQRRMFESAPMPPIDQDRQRIEEMRKQYYEIQNEIHPSAVEEQIREERLQEEEQGNFYRARIEREYFAPDATEQADRFFPAAPSLVRVIGEAIARLEEVLNRVLGNPEAESVLQSVIGRLTERLQVGSNREPEREDIEAIRQELEGAMQAAKEAMQMKGAAPEEGGEPGAIDVPDVRSQMGFILEEVMPRVFELFDESGVSVPALAIQSYEEALRGFRDGVVPACEGNSPECAKTLRSVFSKMEEMRSSMESAMESSVNAEGLQSAIEALMGGPTIEDAPTMEFQTIEGEEDYPSSEENLESEILMPEEIQ